MTWSIKIIHVASGMESPLSMEEIKYFLATSKQNCRVTTVDGNDEPIVHPVWFCFEPCDNKKLYINTNIDSIKAVNIRR